MSYDRFGILHVSESELCELIYKDPNLVFDQILVDNPEQYNQSVESFYAELPKLNKYLEPTVEIEEFDNICQQQWFMPDEYKNLDIAKWVLDQCKQQHELQRVGQELLLYQKKNLFPLLQYLKYLVDTMKKHNIVWGVGRGSSVASYVLYLIGIHSIDSIYYDLPIEEFLKD